MVIATTGVTSAPQAKAGRMRRQLGRDAGGADRVSGRLPVAAAGANAASAATG